jgi:hypothetical protein
MVGGRGPPIIFSLTGLTLFKGIFFKFFVEIKIPLFLGAINGK